MLLVVLHWLLLLVLRWLLLLLLSWLLRITALLRLIGRWLLHSLALPLLLLSWLLCCMALLLLPLRCTLCSLLPLSRTRLLPVGGQRPSCVHELLRAAEPVQQAVKVMGGVQQPAGISAKTAGVLQQRIGTGQQRHDQQAV